ncbi:MAG: dihydrolipoyl dehydrogenase [Dehalococcoidia bacterium]|nr:dihydrolipoyl dehydrogenase [Dehalococcoidia bacterium]
MSEIIADIAVIGGGPAGYSAAVQAARIGKRVALVEKAVLGGTCLNHGCIPTKTLLHSLALLRSMRDCARFGIIGSACNLDIEKLLERQSEVISIMQSGMVQLLDKHNVLSITGEASFSSPRDIEIKSLDDDVMALHADNIIIASGSVPRRLNVQGGDNPYILYSNDLLKLKSIPARLLIIGGGAVGLELAAIMRGAGSSVSIVEIAPNILPYEDTEITSVLERSLKRDGIQIYTNAAVQNIEASRDSAIMYLSHNNTKTTLEADAICVCVGQQPNLSHLKLDAAYVNYEARGIVVDSHMRTSASHIYAAGDVTGENMLAYVATAQGRLAAANAAGRDEAMHYDAIPHCVFTTPEIASVGLNEKEASVKGIEIRCLRSLMAANPYATILGERRGMAKLIVEASSGKLLGAQLVGSGATSLISECAMAVKLGATARDMAHLMHPHPSLAEALQEAALSDMN